MDDKMYCPKCGKEIKKVGVVSMVYSTYSLDGDWLNDNDHSEPQDYYCVECGESFTREMEERLDW